MEPIATSAPTTTIIATPPELEEIGLPPGNFSGKREDYKRFVQNVDLYLDMNKHIYNTPEEVILFFLSFLQEGAAEKWKETFLNNRYRTTEMNEAAAAKIENRQPRDLLVSDLTLDLGTIQEFRESFKQKFQYPPEDAMDKLFTLEQGKRTADEYIAEFKFLAQESAGIEQDIVLIEFFWRGLHSALIDKIFGHLGLPDTIDKWYEKAARLDNLWRQRIKKAPSTSPGRNFESPRNTRNPGGGPNTTNRGQITAEERSDFMKKGKCFNCKKKGHIARECEQATEEMASCGMSQVCHDKFKDMPKTGKDAFAMMKVIIAGLNEKETGIFLDEMKAHGF